jgi:hypothetical protein
MIGAIEKRAISHLIFDICDWSSPEVRPVNTQYTRCDFRGNDKYQIASGKWKMGIPY